MNNSDFQQQDTNRMQGGYYRSDDHAPVMSFAEWLVTLVIMCVPLLNIIILIVWATDKNGNPNRMNWARAYLVVAGVGIIMAMFLFGTLMGTMSHLFNGLDTGGVW